MSPFCISSFKHSLRINIPFRVLDYRVRMYGKDPNKPMRQVVIYLKQTGSALVYQTSFTMERTRHEFDVIRLWEQPSSLFLQYSGLIPFAVLGQSADAEETLRQAAQTLFGMSAVPGR
jgi:predicted transposase YdaD